MNVDGTVFEFPKGEAPIKRFRAPAAIMGLFVVAEGDHFLQDDNSGFVMYVSPSGKVLKSFGAPYGDYGERRFTLDRDHNLWVEGDYKYSLDGTRLSDVRLPHGRQVEQDSQGRVIVAGTDRVTWLDAELRVLRMTKAGRNLGGFALDSQDRVWAYDWVTPEGEAGIYRLTIDGQVETLSLMKTPIERLQLANDDSFWFADRDARILYRMDDSGRVMGAQQLEEGYQAFAVDPAGPLWVGYFHFKGYKPKESPDAVPEFDYSGEAVKYEIK